MRLEVAQRAAALFHERKRHLTVQAGLRKQHGEAKALYDTGRLDAASLRAIALRQAETDAKAAQVETEIRYVLGAGGTVRPPRSFETPAASAKRAEPTLIRQKLEEAGHQHQLAQTMRVEWEALTIDEVVAELQKAAKDELSFVLHPSVVVEDWKVTLRLSGEVPLSTVLSALADCFDWELCFVFRDYGVLVTDPNSAQYLTGPTIPAGVPRRLRSGG